MSPYVELGIFFLKEICSVELKKKKKKIPVLDETRII